MVEDLAAAVLARLGLDIAAAERPFSQANKVFLVGDIVLRIAPTAGSVELVDEAALAPHLPSDIGYPNVIEMGEIERHPFMICERLPGCSLLAAWPSLTESERADALRAVWERLEALHAADLRALPWWNPRPSPFYALETATAAARVDRLERVEAITPAVAKDTRRVLDRFFVAFGRAPNPTMVHTDIHPGNVQWHGEVIALLDFEFATQAPPDLDLDSLVGIPAQIAVGELPVSAADLAPDLAASRDGRVRLHGYAVLRELWALELWWDSPEWRDHHADVAEWRPRRDLEGLLRRVDGV